MALLGHEPVSLDELVASAGLNTDEILATLLDFELNGQIASLPGNRYQRLV